MALDPPTLRRPEIVVEALAGEVAAFGIRVTIAQLGGFDTAWGTTSMRFASPLSAYDGLRESLFGTPVVPWEPTPGDASLTDAPPEAAAAALMAHLDQPAGPLRLLIGDDAPTHVAMALAQRRDDYRQDSRFAWPDSSGPAD